MKAGICTLSIVFFFFFAFNSLTVRAESDAVLYHSVETVGNVVSTTYFKGNGNNENLTPFKKSENTVNDENVCVAKTTYLWDSLLNKWVPSRKIEYTYNQKNVDSVSHSTWNDDKQNWSKPQIVKY